MVIDVSSAHLSNCLGINLLREGRERGRGERERVKQRGGEREGGGEREREKICTKEQADVLECANLTVKGRNK